MITLACIAFIIFLLLLRLFFNGKDKDTRSSSKDVDDSSNIAQKLRASLETSMFEQQRLNDKSRRLQLENQQLREQLRDSENRCACLLLELDEKAATLNAYVEHRNEDLKNIFSNADSAFSYVAALYADYLLIDYDNASHYLINKKRPAISEGLRIQALKLQTKNYLLERNKLKYQLDYLLNLYPQLEDFISSEDGNPSINVQDNISKETWNALSDASRSQLILDNYLKRNKSKWEIGRDYELYVGYRYSLQGYQVDYFGSYNGLEDLGRDLIVKKDGEVGIIQCKYWSSRKQIHEKHIAQLYGTVVSYIIENNYLPSLVHGIFITSASLSETAKKFAAFLDIKYKENYPMGNFSHIKCNINKDKDGVETKIYHLPTDQQYDNVKIVNDGECFVFTAEEAENLGFRHAYKWHNK